MARPLQVDVIVHAPTVFRHCQHCELVWRDAGFGRGVRADQLRSALPPDLQEEYAAVWDWLFRLVETQRGRVAVNVIDAASLRGFWSALRHGVHRYPAIVVAGREKVVGMDLGAADALVARHLRDAAPA